MTFSGWDRVEIQTVDGLKTAVAPVIISASRATDLPAFHGDWFMNRLAAGYVKWINPFNQQAQYISFKQTRVIVFWTKNARPFFKHLPQLDKMGLNYYFTFTVNDYEAEGLEPNLPGLAERIETFQQLAEKIGKRRVIWRFDPLILSHQLTVDRLLTKIQNVGQHLHQYTEKLIISFADISHYRRVKNNLIAGGFADYREFDQASMLAVAAGLKQLNQTWQLAIATCGEKIDLAAYGIAPNKCIDDQLMSELFPEDRVLMEFLGYQVPPPALFPSFRKAIQSRRRNLKDRGQRNACGCIVSKDLGQYNTCMHLCLYCYANHSAPLVRRNFRRRDVQAETIVEL
ncbi:MAG: DUF1848 domain-containing protein [Firmicutes bacterium]|nr:DUF1848 domain-containing protein [Bacillota bacterium]